MTRTLCLALIAIITVSVAGAEVYVPLTGSGDVRIVNRSERNVAAAIDDRNVTLAAGESIELPAASFGAVRVRSDEPLEITRAVLDPHDAISMGEIDARQDGIGIINPNEDVTSVTLSADGEMVTMMLSPHTSRVVRMDRLFVKQADGTVTFTASRRVLLFGYGAKGVTPAAVVIPSRRHSVRFPIAAVTPVPQTVVLTPSKDATLYQTADGSLANGAGVHIFAGMTSSFSMRRALLAFDLPSKIPAGSRITGVKLRMRVSSTISGVRSMELHRVTADWGEGTSNAGTLRDGQGIAAKSGDATWIHTFFPNQQWSKAGGDFAAAADATAGAGGNGSDVTWETSASLVARVQAWVDQPSTNFGWLILGDETSPSTAKRFDSREFTPDATQPSLTVDFTH
jgi:hypothetical protein